MTGKGSVNHNSRKFHAKNTDPERSYLNVEYCNENVKDVYHELFDEALARYNEKQTRSDRRIDDYYEKIRSGKQEKPFHEIILQIGDKDDMGAKTENGELAVKLGGAAKFCISAAKWVLYTTFFLFLAFLSVQGITAAIYDNVSVRAAKFAMSKYIPVIGGYLSEGFNVILAGSVLIKNAVGLTAVVVLLMTVLPVLIKIIAVSLSLKLAGAITEPFEGGKITSLLNSVSSGVIF